MSTAPKLKIRFDGPVTIAVGRSRKETNWKNREMLWSELVSRFSQTTRTAETYDEYVKMPKSQQDAIKDVGGFVGGTLKSGRRKLENVVWRQLLTLDIDYAKGDIWAAVETMFCHACVMYSTHKHRPGSPRLRLVMPLTRPITPDEYPAVARRVAADFGIDFFDDTTYEPHRLMYWPSTPRDGEYLFKYLDEPWLDPDKILARYPDWRDPSYWPESSRVEAARKKQAEKQGDPLTKPGMVGAFCRTYTISAAIETFLSDIYEPVGEGRYTYLPGSTVAGLVVYDNDTFAFSHHGTDPVSGKLVNTFDLVRLHKFKDLDDEAEPGTPVAKLPSYLAMLDLARKDEAVKMTIGQERLAEAQAEFEGLEGDASAGDNKWLTKLETDRKGRYQVTIDNVVLILENDPHLKGKIGLNEFSHGPVILGNVPWRKVKNTLDGDLWRDSDDAALRHYIEAVYEISGPSKINDALAIVQEKHRFHPIRDYLDSLSWDGLPRLDTLLIDYLGAEDTEYVRTVTRKAFTAAVARIYQPGGKFDYMIVLVGPQGIGKSLILKLLGQRWFSDSLTTVQGKEAYEQLQGTWLVEMAELSATKKAEIESIKHFISKQEDIYRAAYGRRASKFPRQCVFFGTTNDQEFLRDKTGNRRFWPVDVGVEERKKSLWKDMDQFEIDQIWAEAVQVWKDGERLYLEPDMEAEAMQKQEEHTEESSKAGLIREYLDTPLPEDWTNLDIGARRRYLHGTDFGEAPKGTVRRDRVCAIEIWVELFEGEPKQFGPIQAREINDILRRTPGWMYHKNKLRFGKIYGTQRAFIRTDSVPKMPKTSVTNVPKKN